jgi:hypothetical protein
MTTENRELTEEELIEEEKAFAEVETEEEPLTQDELKDLQNLGELQTYIKTVQEMADNEELDEETRQRAVRQVFMIRSSYTFEVFNELRPTMKYNTLVKKFKSLKRDAERKMERNESFKFVASGDIEHYIKAVLPEHLKDRSKGVAAFIYAFIMTASLKPDGYAIFVYFLIKNINGLDREFAERETLVNNLHTLALQIHE